MNTHDDFRRVISLERAHLTRLSDFWNTQVKCDSTLSKDYQGRIRAAVGKTRLLLAEKFKQFEGLVEQSANNTSEKEISLNDLQGFWDLVLIQVHEIKEMFRELEAGNEKASTDFRKSAKPKSPEAELRKEPKSGNTLKKKLGNDYLEHTEKKLRDVHEKDKGRSEAGDLKSKISLSKL